MPAEGPSHGALYAPPGSALAEFARGLAWFWGLGPLSSEPVASSVGLGTEAEMADLVEQVGDGRLAGAVLTAGVAGPAVGSIPARRRVAGVPEFAGGTRVNGEFTIFEDGTPGVSSTLGRHAVIEDGVLIVGIDPERDWGRMDAFWAYEAIADYVAERIDRPLTKLPPIGCLRLDDTPGMALHQLQGRDKSDRRQRGRLGRLSKRLQRANAVLSVAVVAEALEDGRRVPLERVWPDSVRVLQAGVEAGAFEPICHGLVHMDPDALERGEPEYREFLNLDAARAGEHIDRAIEWQTRHLGKPRTFCAPAWAYGPAGDQEAAKRGLIRWYRAKPGPLLEDGRLYESLIGELYGLHRLDYSPLRRLAAVGIPPVVAMHGAMLDMRLQNLMARRDILTLARLFFVRDVSRLMRVEGVRWVGVNEFVDLLGAHGEGAAPIAR